MTFSVHEHARSIVLFGGNGDLSYRKLLPALFNLERKDLLPESIRIIGCSRTVLSDEEFRAQALEGLKGYATLSPEEAEEATKNFLQRLSFLNA